MGGVKRTLTFLVLILVIVAAGYGYVISNRERTYRDLIARGDAALANDDLAAAVADYSGAIAIHDSGLAGYVKRAEAHYRRGEHEAALRDLRQALAIDDQAPRPLELNGDVNYALGRFERAAEGFERYLRIDDRTPRVHYKLALARYTAGQPAAAVGALRRAVALEETFAEAHYLLGLCLRDVQKASDAVPALERAVRLAPAMLQAREELADVYDRLGRTRDRLSQLEALVALDPQPSRHVALGLAYASVGDTDRAVLTLGRAAERYPDHPYTYVALGRVWLDAAQERRDRIALSKALEALEQAAGADESSEALTLFGRALLLASDEVLAARMLTQATQKLPADPLAFYYLSEASEQTGARDVARAALLDYLALAGENLRAERRVAIAVRVANLSMDLNEPATAVEWFERAAAGGAGTSVLLRLADAQLRNGQLDRARETIDKILSHDPANRQALALQRRLR